ncbi:hypothetical protein SISSUDRAFT_1059684 [Sistotremastrum suecicum HHB10207 ss-3]|uniref:Nucleoporin Nup120/160-domain-containing protein n=1 Tax=Sistotremastrum suecicum HHB10207 ss-3 TaxID=1314776 RepID=A0A166FYC9_9AGAM|nr:hypothetical protein SISSUDRAFT_1059684 [Sistotremastrum suecicum HHB10207 ss-3]
MAHDEQIFSSSSSRPLVSSQLTGDYTLVSTHISSLWPPHKIKSENIETSRRNLPLPDPSSSSIISLQHASIAFASHFPETGGILTRVVNGGYTLELISLDRDTEPIRFHFPAPIIPKPSLAVWRGVHLRIFVVIESGSLFRLSFPIDAKLWHSPRIASEWQSEHRIRTHPEQVVGPVHAADPETIVIGTKDGGILRLEARDHGEWWESALGPGSFLTSLVSFLPFQSSADAVRVVAIASLPPPTASTYIFTLSRDRQIRAWLPKGCVAAKIVDEPHSESVASRATSPFGRQPSTLLPPDAQPYLKAFTTNVDTNEPSSDEDIILLFFSPSNSIVHGGGIFYFYRMSPSREIVEIGSFPSSNYASHCQFVDCVVLKDELHVLWEDHGSSVLECTSFRLRDGTIERPHSRVWKLALQAPQDRLTPTRVEELSLRPGALADILVQQLLRPDHFSQISLRTALQQYTDALLSVPGKAPAILKHSFTNLSEHLASVVGCTVDLTIDSHTGHFRRAEYWTALKRDWEGFIARCNAVERSARCPLSVAQGGEGQVFVVERETFGMRIPEDEPLRVYRRLGAGQEVPSNLSTLTVAWSLRNHCIDRNSKAVYEIETQFSSLIRQEIAFSYCDTVSDVADRWLTRHHKTSFEADIDRSRSGPFDDASIQSVIQLLSQLTQVIKSEVSRLESGSVSLWSRALTTSYLMSTISVRFDLALVIALYLFCRYDELVKLDASVLSRFFALFRSLHMLQLVSNQPLGGVERSELTSKTATELDFAVGFGSLRMTSPFPPQAPSNKGAWHPYYSVLYSIVANPEQHESIYDTVQSTLSGFGLLGATSSAHALTSEVEFCNNLRGWGHHNLAMECVRVLPRTAAVVYLQALLLLQQARPDDASVLFKTVAGQLGLESSLSTEDRYALEAILPETVHSESPFEYYEHLAALFNSIHATSHVILFCNLAIQSATGSEDCRELWKKVIQCNLDLSLLEEAYMSIVACPYPEVKSIHVELLVQALCHSGTPDLWNTLNFAELSEEVENALSWKARNVDVLSAPNYAKILYSWYIRRADYRSAARVMYEHARRLSGFSVESNRLVEIRRQEAEAYLIAINALSLLEPNSAWIVVPLFRSVSSELSISNNVSRLIPDDLFATRTNESEVVDLLQLRRELCIVNARLDLVQIDSVFLRSPDLLLGKQDIIRRYTELGSFDKALAFAHTLGEDMTEIFERLTEICLRLYKGGDSAAKLLPLEWARSPRILSVPGTLTERAWRYLDLTLQQYDGVANQFSYRQVVLERIVQLSGPSAVPQKLFSFFVSQELEYLIRVLLRYGYVENASQLSLDLISKNSKGRPRQSDSAGPDHLGWMPYSLFEQVIIASDKTSQERLEKAIADRISHQRSR